MVTVAPFGAEAFPVGVCWNTSPGVALALACSVFGSTLNPAPCRIVWAVEVVSPMTLGTVIPPPDTERVTLLPGFTTVFWVGLCLVTVPAGSVEAVSGTWLTISPLACRALAAVLAFSPTTLGMVIFCGPAETYRVTTVSAFSLLPWAGLDLMTMFFLTLELDWGTTVDFRCAAAISFCAWVTCRPLTRGTA